MKRLMIIDLMNMAFRAYWGFAKNGPLAYNGKLTFMCYGVAIALNRLLRDYRPDYVIIAAEGAGKTFRHDMYPGYKAGRKEKETDFIAQLPDLYTMLEHAYGLKVVKVPNVEADDVIGTAARRLDWGAEVYIVSGDKDFMQLVDDKTFLVRQAAEGYETLGKEIVTEKFGVRPDQVVDALAIIGDSADAIPGVKGIGEKGAAQLLAAFGNLETVYENLAFIKPTMATKLAKSKDMAFLSKKLAQIDTSVELGIELSDCVVPTDILRREQLVKFYQDFGFKSLIVSPDIENQIPDKFLSTFGEFPV